MPSKLTDEQVAQIKELREQKVTWKEIANIIGKPCGSLKTAYNAITQEERLKSGKKMDLDKVLYLKAVKKMTYKQIAEYLGTTEQVIKNTMYRAKLSSSSNQKSYRQRQKEEKEKREKNLERIDQLAATYSNNAIAKSILKGDNVGRASAVNTHLVQCITIGSMVDIENINSLYAAFEAYIKLCAESDCPITLTSACLAIGINKGTLVAWRNGKSRGKEYKEFANSVYYVIQAGIETCMAVGLINPIIGIWWEKSHFREIEADKGMAQDNLSDFDTKKSAEDIVAEYEGMVLPD